jgi:TusA-related sulfurtransferase
VGLTWGELAFKLKEAMDALHPGEVLEVRTDNPGVGPDLVAWCGGTRYRCVGLGKADSYTRYFIRKEIRQ